MKQSLLFFHIPVKGTGTMSPRSWQSCSLSCYLCDWSVAICQSQALWHSAKAGCRGVLVHVWVLVGIFFVFTSVSVSVCVTETNMQLYCIQFNTETKEKMHQNQQYSESIHFCFTVMLVEMGALLVMQNSIALTALSFLLGLQWIYHKA